MVKTRPNSSGLTDMGKGCASPLAR